ncbi:MAG: DedA family protein [Methanobacteriota archaeon]|nr:MAG: DedA family protein [Euryarchaeota archaeon]
MSVLGALTEILLGGVQAFGYAGVFIAMFVEGVITPIPSEMILPFAGYLAAKGELSAPLVVLVASLAAMLGSGGAYGLGLRLGRPFVLRYGRYVFLDASDLDRAERWFQRYGNVGVFLANCVPGARSIVAYPAGAARMRAAPFLVATFGGALVWNSVLVAAGWYLLDGWRWLVDTFEYIDLVAVVAIVTGIGVYVYRNKRRAGARAVTPRTE